MQGLSAGRVQSVATRLVVERERERIAFTSAGYWDLDGVPRPGPPSTRAGSSPSTAPAWRPAATSRSDGALTAKGGRPRSSPSTRRRPGRSPRRSPTPRSPCVRVDEKPYRRSPAAPFMTSTLQQEASRKLRFSCRRRCGSPSGCTRTATSPICVPTRRRCRASAITGCARRRAGHLRRRQRRRRAAAVHPQGQERAGGARGDPPVRRHLPYARRGRPRAVRATSSRSTT